MKSDLVCSQELPFAGHFNSYQKTLSTPDHGSQLKDLKTIAKKPTKKRTKKINKTNETQKTLL